MKPTAEQIEQIQTLLIDEGAAVAFRRKGTKEKEGYWYLTKSDVSEAGPADEKGDLEFYRDRDVDDLLAFAEKNDLTATVNLTGRNTGDEEFEDWEHLARYMGITDLVVLSTKVPKRVAQKFQFYATQSTTVSEKLRSLVYDYTIKEIKDNAERDMFR